MGVRLQIKAANLLDLMLVVRSYQYFLPHRFIERIVYYDHIKRTEITFELQLTRQPEGALRDWQLFGVKPWIWRYFPLTKYSTPSFSFGLNRFTKIQISYRHWTSRDSQPITSWADLYKVKHHSDMSIVWIETLW